MSHNKLTGPVPAGIGQLNSLQKLDLSHNRLSFMVVDPLHLQKHVFEFCCWQIPFELAAAPLSVGCDLTYNSFFCPLPVNVISKYCLPEDMCMGTQVGAMDETDTARTLLFSKMLYPGIPPVVKEL